ncbi:hypothetical protein J4Q44_G00206540 [Coregonus suidteri]|uniref:Fibulin C-terminal Ig-like domain-containing protein n=1 Tax=Coregonus suidteri TaxID=861788 RepID=A0AAN8LS13_9TELE
MEATICNVKPDLPTKKSVSGDSEVEQPAVHMQGLNPPSRPTHALLPLFVLPLHFILLFLLLHHPLLLLHVLPAFGPAASQFHGSSRCTCDAVFSISGHDSNICSDIDDGQLFPRAQPGRLCMQTCINTTVRCKRNQCVVGDKACSQAPNFVSFHFLPVVPNMSAPWVLFWVSAARAPGDMLRFGLLGSRCRSHFSVRRSGRQTPVSPVQGPATLEAEVEMSYSRVMESEKGE